MTSFIELNLVDSKRIRKVYLGLAEQQLTIAVAVGVHGARDPSRMQNDARQPRDAHLERHLVLLNLQKRLMLLLQPLTQIAHLSNKLAIY